jgi:hypothetical protein
VTACRLIDALRRSLTKANEGSCLVLDWSMVKGMQPLAADRMQVPFYRTKLNSWMAQFEETYRFILLEADPYENRDWANLCIEQVNAILSCNANAVMYCFVSDNFTSFSYPERVGCSF